MQPTAIDLFAGAGGATQGLRDAGFDVVAAVEIDSDAAATWVSNHPGVMFQADVMDVSSQMLLGAGGLKPGELDLLKACPPCQGFSTLRGSKTPDDTRNDLVLDTLRFVRELQPRSVLIENVPGLRRDGRFSSLTNDLRSLGYALRDYIVDAQVLGVPQRRRRLVVIAVRDDVAPPEFDKLVPASSRRSPMTAGQMLSRMPPPSGQDAVLVADTWRQPKGIVQKRIAAIPLNGTRFDLPDHLQLECHKNLKNDSGATRRNATGSYGRIRSEFAAPTMTTRCTTPACGSFIHPSENRGISLREAAAFQTFPLDYVWVGGYGSIERQIGNAVPVWMAEELGRAVVRLLDATPTRAK